MGKTNKSFNKNKEELLAAEDAYEYLKTWVAFAPISGHESIKATRSGILANRAKTEKDKAMIAENLERVKKWKKDASKILSEFEARIKK